MSNNIKTPKNFKPYRTVEGKFAAHIGPYFIKNKYPNTIFGTFIGNKVSNLNEVAHGGFLMAYADSVGGFYAYNKVKKPIVTVTLNCNPPGTINGMDIDITGGSGKYTIVNQFKG